VKAPARLAATIAILFVAGGFLITHSSVTSSRSLPKPAVRLAVSGTGAAPHHVPPNDDSGIVDLYGNEINDAIATYTLDPAGSLYELHSPQTELPRLGSPKS
jgi:hypothetical protein